MRDFPVPLFLRVLVAVCVLSVCTPLQSAIQAQGKPASSFPQPNRVVDQDLNGGTQAVRLPGHIPAWAKHSADLGPVPDTKPVQLNIGLSRSPALQAAFTSFLADQQNSSSPHFHQWLTPEEIGAQYGPTQHDLDAVTNWLAGQGFHVDSISPARTSIRVTASAAVVGHALHTQLHLFASGTNTRQAPTVEPSVPAALTPVVAYVAGLADVPYYTDVHKQFIPSAAPANSFNQTTSARPNFTASDGVTHYMFPADFNTIYDITPLLNANVNGSGQKIAILGGSRLTPSDLTTWESLSNLPSYQPNYIVPPSLVDPGQTNDNNQDEPTLDFERAYGTAPGAKIDMIIAQNSLTFANTDTMLLYEVNTLRDPVLSLSFGVCEAEVAPSYIQNEDSIYSQAAAQGISVFVSSGDSGVAGCEIHGQAAPLSQQFPSINADCASSYVTCVGGTQFNDLGSGNNYWAASNGAGSESAIGYIPEGAFNEVDGQTSGTFQIFATGGGPSTVIPKPSWQKGNGVPADGARDTPDVSFSSSSHDGYIGCLLYTTYDCTGTHGALVFSGTSAAAPSMAGIAALIDQKDGTRQGNLNPLLYRSFSDAFTDFHDATPASSGVASCSVTVPSTCNNSTPGPNGLSGGISGYPLTTGYDLATGLGSLDVKNFVTTSALPHTTTVIAVTPSPATISQSIQFSVTVTGSGSAPPTGTVEFYVNGNPFSSVIVAGGTVSAPGTILKPAATYTVTATYFGDSNNAGSDSAPVTVVVTNPNAVASTTTLAVTTLSTASDKPEAFAATVSGAKGAATGTVQFSIDGMAQGSPVTIAGGVATLGGVYVPTGSHSIQATYSGDDTYAASTGTVSITSTAANSSTSNALSPSTTTPTGTFLASTTVTGTAGGPTPTGTVTLFQGTNSIVTLPLYNGVASVELSGGPSGLAPGTYPLNWVYSGNTIYSGSTSPVVNLIVASSGITLGAAKPTLSLTAGASATDPITVNSTGFAGAEALTCAIVYKGTGKIVSAPTCSLSPGSVTVAANGTATSTLTVSTTGQATSGSISSSADNRGLPLGDIGGMTLAALLLCLVPRRSRRTVQAARLMSGLIFLAASLTLLSGCGSGSRSSIPGTTAGPYIVTVTASSSASVSSSVAIALTVQ